MEFDWIADRPAASETEAGLEIQPTEKLDYASAPLDIEDFDGEFLASMSEAGAHTELIGELIRLELQTTQGSECARFVASSGNIADNDEPTICAV